MELPSIEVWVTGVAMILGFPRYDLEESDIELTMGEDQRRQVEAIYLKVWPWGLLVVMEKAGGTGNRR